MSKGKRIYHNTLVDCLRDAAAGDPDARAAASLAVRIAQHKRSEPSDASNTSDQSDSPPEATDDAP